MGLLLLLLILGWLGLEVWSLIFAADLLGSGWMALWATVVTSVIGVMVLGRAQQALQPAALMRDAMKGGNPFTALMRALVPALAGLLMILPGFAGDALAVLLLFPLTRPLMMLVFGGLLMLALKRLAARGSLQGAAFMQGMNFSQFSSGPQRARRDAVVDAEFEVVDNPTLPPRS